jgi:hypothetical protein
VRRRLIDRQDGEGIDVVVVGSHVAQLEQTGGPAAVRGQAVGVEEHGLPVLVMGQQIRQDPGTMEGIVLAAANEFQVNVLDGGGGERGGWVKHGLCLHIIPCLSAWSLPRL